MPQPKIATDDRILDALPAEIRAAISTYANESGLSANAVIEGAIRHFLELDTSLKNEVISTAEDTSLLAALPPILQSQVLQYA
ncbi:MAG: hypothetical protein AAFY72_17625, partial [Cyanobacteria bacterium J06649_4]